MAEHEKNAHLYTMLEPWLAHLSRFPSPDDPYEQSHVLPGDVDGFVWLKTWPIEPASALQIEGLELLTLLAYADWGLWKDIVLKLWPDRTNKWEQELPTRPATVGVELCYTSHQDMDTMMEALAMSSQLLCFSQDFGKARLTLLNVMAKRGQIMTEIPVRIRRVNFREPVQAQALKLLQLTIMQQRMCRDAVARLDQREDAYNGLRVRAVELFLCYDGIRSVPLLQYMMEIAACGVDVGSIHPPPDSVWRKNDSLHMDAMTKLLPVAGQDEYKHPRGVSSCSITGRQCIDLYPAHFSALRANETVRRFHYDQDCYPPLSDEEKRRAWAWFAYGLFRRRSTRGHRIRQLKLNAGALDQGAIDVMKTVFKAKNPLVILFNLEKVDRDPVGTISASRFVLADPQESAGIRDKVEWSSNQLYTGLDVIEKRQEWFSVLLPGWGKAWVHQSDALEACRSERSDEFQSIPGVEVQGVTHERQDVVVAWLHLIGRGVRRLLIPSHYEMMAVDETLPKIFDACPDLERLEVCGMALASLNGLVEAYASGRVRAERLILHDMRITNEETSLQHLFNALGSRQHSVALHLKKLTIGSIRIASLVRPAVMASLTAMLQTNRQLSHVEIQYGYSHFDPRQLEHCRGLFQALDNDRILRRLPLASKLAFLSCVTDASTDQLTNQVLGRHKLDANVVSLIFQFAATRFSRRVVLTSSSH